MISTGAQVLTRQSINSSLTLYLKQEVLGDRKARIGEDEKLDDIFNRSPDILALGRNGLALGLAQFISQTYGISRDEVASYDSSDITVGRAVDLIYDRVSGGKR